MRIPLGGDPSFECPETKEVIMPYVCRHCPLFQDWGGTGIERCKHEYEEYKAIEEENRRRDEEKVRENQLFMEELEEERSRGEAERREIQEYLAERDEYEMELMQSIAETQRQLREEIEKGDDFDADDSREERDYDEQDYEWE
jgi:hypothetical protein